MSSQDPSGRPRLDPSTPAASAADAEPGSDTAPDAVEILASLDVAGLAVRSERRGGAVIVRADGEVDMTSASALSKQLKVAAGSATALVVAELNAVRFFGSAGLAALMACHQQCGGRNIAFRVAAAQPSVLRPIELTGLDEELALYPTLEQALIG